MNIINIGTAIEDEIPTIQLSDDDIERLEDERKLTEFISGEGQINSCDALRVMDGVPLVQEDE